MDVAGSGGESSKNYASGKGEERRGEGKETRGFSVPIKAPLAANNVE